MTVNMPISGCDFSSIRITPNTPNATIGARKATALPRPSVSSQAVTTAKQGFRNSLGWIDMPGQGDPAARALDLHAMKQGEQSQQPMRE